MAAPLRPALAMKLCVLAATALGAQAAGQKGLPLDLRSAIEARFAHHDPEHASHLLRRLGLTDNGGQTSVSCIASVLGNVGAGDAVGQTACFQYIWNATTSSTVTGGAVKSNWVAAGNIDPIWNTYFPADNIIPAPVPAQLQPPYVFGSSVGKNMTSYGLHQGLPVTPQPGWGGGPNVPLSPPSMKVWGVHATPSTNANLAAGDASVLLSWFLGEPSWNVTVNGQGGGFQANAAGNGYSLVCAAGSTTCALGTLQSGPAAAAFVPKGVTFAASISVGTSPGAIAAVPVTGLTCLQYLRVMTGYNTNYLSPYICHATIRNLARKTTYWYDISTYVGGAAVVGPSTGAYTMPSATYSAAATHFKFTTMSGPSTGCPNEAACPSVYPVPLALMGDMGQSYNSSMTAQYMATYLSSTPVQAVLIAGDYTYADNNDALNTYFETTSGETVNPMRWDSWAVMWQSVTGQSQWVHSAGNHDMEWSQGTKAKSTDTSTSYGFLSSDQRYPYQAWSARYPNGAVPTSSYGDSWSQHYYSQNLGPVHMIVLNSLIPFVVGTEQYNWFLQDLMSVDRSKQPWLIVQFHAPMYHTYLTHYKEQECMRLIYEPLFYLYRVDFVLGGHVHAYERTHPMYNYTQDACGPVYIVIGDAGNNEGPYRDYMDDIIPGSPGVSYCKAASPGTIKAGVSLTNSWSASYQRAAQPTSCTTLTFQPAQDGTTAGVVLNPYDTSNSTYWCQSKQALWSAYRDPSFGFASLNLTSDNTATYSWFRNIDQAPGTSGLSAADVAQYTRYNGPCAASTSTTTTTTGTTTATLTTSTTSTTQTLTMSMRTTVMVNTTTTKGHYDDTSGAQERAGRRVPLALAAVAAAVGWAHLLFL